MLRTFGENTALMPQTLKELLEDWTDADVAAFHLARCLGVMGPDVPAMASAKHVFWSSNSVGDTLYQMLQLLVGTGVMEHDEEESRYRWSPAFKGSWET